jgi:hypothetical protein
VLASTAAANGAAHAVWTHPASGAQLFVGAMTAAQDASFLAEAGVKHVVSCIGSENSGYSFHFSSENDQETTGTDDSFGCLSSHPGEQWLYMAVGSPGDIDIHTSSPEDHDVAVWGRDYYSTAVQLLLYKLHCYRCVKLAASSMALTNLAQ